MRYDCREKKSLSLLTLICLLGSALSPALCAAAPPKDGADKENPNSVTGEITALEPKGRTLILTITTEDGETQEQILASRTPVLIKGQGDSGFLRPGAAVYTKAAVVKQRPKEGQNQNANNQNARFQGKQPVEQKFFSKKFTVYMNGTRNRGWKQGENKEVIEIVGQVIAIEGEQMALNLGRAGTGVIQLESGFTVDFESTDRDLIAVGDKIEMLGKPSRGKFRPRSFIVTLQKPVKSAEYFAKEDKSKRRHGQKDDESDDKNAFEGDSKTPFAEIDSKEKKSTESK